MIFGRFFVCLFVLVLWFVCFGDLVLVFWGFFCEYQTGSQSRGVKGSATLGLPSTREVSKVTFAALRLPAGKFKPIFSSLSRKDLPPFFDLALELQRN